MANPKHPIITFAVNLETPDFASQLPPDRFVTSDNIDTSITRTSQQKNYRTSWIPGLLTCENVALEHSGQFTVYGLRAAYLKSTFTTGTNPLLTVIEQTFESE